MKTRKSTTYQIWQRKLDHTFMLFEKTIGKHVDIYTRIVMKDDVTLGNYNLKFKDLLENFTFIGEIEL